MIIYSYSFHEIGIYDLPAVINHISEVNKNDKIIYVGHSMGTTVSYVLASEKPEISSKIKAIFSVSPIAFLSNTKFLALQIASRFKGIIKVAL